MIWRIIAIIVVVLVVLAGMVSCWKQSAECEQRGGVLVKGAIGYACVPRQ